MSSKVTIMLITDGEWDKEVLHRVYNQTYENYDVILYQNRTPLLGIPEHQQHLHFCVYNRNKARDLVIKNNPDYVLIMDMDVVIPYTTLESFVLQMDYDKKKVLSGWVPFKERDDIWMNGRWVDDHVFEHYKAPLPSLVVNDFAPLGCTMMPIKAIKKIPFSTGEDRILKRSNELCFAGENLQYSIDLQDMGYSLYLDGDVICEHKNLDDEPRQLVYILSHMRAGSTLLKALLGNAEDVSHISEFDHWEVDVKEVNKTCSEKIIVIKKPLGYRVKDRESYFVGEGKIIRLTRNKQDVVRSMQKLPGLSDINPNLISYAYDEVEEILDNLVKDRGDVIHVTYENILNDPIGITKQLFKFIGSKETKGYSTYESIGWKWGTDDASEKIKSLRVLNGNCNN